jgi:hypothetical protein
MYQRLNVYILVGALLLLYKHAVEYDLYVLNLAYTVTQFMKRKRNSSLDKPAKIHALSDSSSYLLFA